MGICKLKPACKDYLWGGRRLAEEYGKEYDGQILAETWELSCHPDGPSIVANGAYAGKTLQQYIEAEGRRILGTHCRRFRDFPILIKFIDARDNLSVQVHPDNRYALKNEGQYGKTEMWYVVDAGENAFLYYGFKKEISREELEKRIKDDTLLEVLNAVPVKKGDVLFIESGTIHAIGKDILIAEIQQNSNITYRVYDYGRKDKNGRKRDLHIEKALAVTKRVPILKNGRNYPHIADCDYFTVDKLNLDGKVMKRMEGYVSEESFASLLFLDGEGTITCEGDCQPFKKGDSFFLAAGSGDYRIEGICDALVTTIRDKAGAVRAGVAIGGADTRIGLIDDHQKILISEMIPTKTGLPAKEMICGIAAEVQKLLEIQGIAMDQCIGIGIGVPGTVDRRNGIVRYSNNIHWDQVELVKEMGNCLPIPVWIANDADCAALGEAVVRAGTGYEDVIMITLGTGVGGSIILDGKLYDKKRVGGSEIGHMVIVENGKPCSCGRRGCLEAYVSVPALKREAQCALGRELTLEEIQEAAASGNQKAQKVLEEYKNHLGAGIVNIVNIFRPQLIILGGTFGVPKEQLLEFLRDVVKSQCFGKGSGELPDIETSMLGEDGVMIGAAGLI